MMDVIEIFKVNEVKSQDIDATTFHFHKHISICGFELNKQA